MKDTVITNAVRKGPSVVTTLCKTGDRKLHSVLNPRYSMIDEDCQSVEIETFLMWVCNVGMLKYLSFIRGFKQLSATVKT